MGTSAVDADRAARDALRDGWRAAGWYPDLTVGDAIAAGARNRPDDQLIFRRVEGEEEVATLAELHAGAGRVASQLARAGVVAGASVIVQAAADRTSVEVLSALWQLGATVVPIVAGASLDELAHVVAETGASTAIVPIAWRGHEVAGPIAERAADLGLHLVVVLDDDAPSGAVPLSALPEGPVPGRPDVATTDIACVLYTSGSTAEPKGVQHTHETFLFGLTIGVGEGRSLLSFPAGHVAAVLGLLRPLCVGGLTVVLDRWSARAAVEAIEEHRITSSAGTPFFLATLLDEAERTGADISALERFLCGAAAVPPALLQRAEAAGIISWRTYGSTEHPAVCGGGPDDPEDKRHHTDGKPMVGNEIRLVDEAGRDVAPGEDGQILSRGPKQFVGYRNPDLDAEAFDGTWFRTGDVGRLDPDGHLIVTDRLKDIIIRGGENIAAAEVEHVLGSHPDVHECSVIAAPDPVFGEQVCAVIVPRQPGRPPALESLVAHAEAAGLAAHKRPTVVRTVEELPRTSAGKVRKAELKVLLVPGLP
jgi:non-ribosomal peptide synthetase component E (peptide arylation enzyme)